MLMFIIIERICKAGSTKKAQYIGHYEIFCKLYKLKLRENHILY